MRTIKKITIGLAVLAVSVMGIQAQEKTIWEKYTLDYKDSGLKKLELQHGVYKAGILNLRNCDLSELVLPTGILGLYALDLRGNNNLTNLFIQMDTSVDVRGRLLSIRLNGDMRKNMKISLPSWMVSTNQSFDGNYLHGPILKTDLEGFKEVEIRPNGVELVRVHKTLPFLKTLGFLLGDTGNCRCLPISRSGGMWKLPTRFGLMKQGMPFMGGEPYVIVWGQTKPSWYGEYNGFYRLKPPELPVSDIPVLTIENKERAQ